MSSLAAVLYTISSALFLLLGARYLIEQRLLSAHAALLDRRWRELSDRERFLLMMFEKGLGFSIGGVGALILILVYSPLADTGRWAAIAATMSGLSIAGPATAFGLVAARRFDAPIPWQVGLAVSFVLVGGLLSEALAG